MFQVRAAFSRTFVPPLRQDCNPAAAEGISTVQGRTSLIMIKNDEERGSRRGLNKAMLNFKCDER